MDCHTRLDPAQAVWFCREIEPLGLFVVEDPIRSEYWQGYRMIRQHVNVPLAAGEQWENKWEFRQAIEEDLIDYVRIDLCIAGGLTEAKKIAGAAETHYMKLLLHNPLGPICTAACLHLDIACPNAAPQEVAFRLQPCCPMSSSVPLSWKISGCTLPTAPGLGIHFNREAAKQHPADMTEPPHLHQRDGSYTNN